MMENAAQFLTEHYRIPLGLLRVTAAQPSRTSQEGFFRFGDLTCFGQCSDVAVTKNTVTASCITSAISHDNGALHLPFNPNEVIKNLLYERYVGAEDSGGSAVKNALRTLYYQVRPMLSVSMRAKLKKLHLNGWRKVPFPRWPADTTADDLRANLLLHALKANNQTEVPFIWFWPEGAQSCVIITHDVETEQGLKFCPELINLNSRYGVKASFQLVPEERYTIDSAIIDIIESHGCEVNIHDLNHDGQLFRKRDEFVRRAVKINEYARFYGTRGFRSAALYRNLEWFPELKVEYDMSVPNVGHLDPQRGGCCTVLPFWIENMVELPVTTVQDYMLFYILESYSLDTWKEQIETINNRNGLISFIVHPDYIIDQRPRATYEMLLTHIRDLVVKSVWHALPRDVNEWWRQRSQMSLVLKDAKWQIEGLGSERARVAFARIENDRLSYTIQ